MSLLNAYFEVDIWTGFFIILEAFYLEDGDGESFQRIVVGEDSPDSDPLSFCHHLSAQHIQLHALKSKC